AEPKRITADSGSASRLFQRSSASCMVRVGVAPSSSKTNDPTSCSNIRLSQGTSARKPSLGPANTGVGVGGACQVSDRGQYPNALQSARETPFEIPAGQEVHLLLHDDNRKSCQ